MFRSAPAKPTHRNYTPKGRRRVTVESLEERRVLDVAGADLAAALVEIQQELNDIVSSQASNTLLGEDIPGFSNVRLSDHINLNALVGDTIDAATTFLNLNQTGNQNRHSTNVSGLLGDLTDLEVGGVDNVIRGQLVGGANGDDTVTARFWIEPTVEGVDIDLPDSLGLDPFVLEINPNAKLIIRPDLKVRIDVIIEDTTGNTNGDGQINVTVDPDDVELSLALSFASSPLSVNGDIANLAYQATLTPSYNPTLTIDFTPPTSGTPVALENLSNRVQSGDLTLSTSVIDLDADITLDATGPLPQFQYVTKFTLDLSNGVDKQDDNLDQVLLNGVDATNSNALINAIAGDALRPVIAEIDKVIPEDVRKLLLGEIDVGGVNLMQFLNVAGNTPLPPDDTTPARLTPIDIAASAAEVFTGGTSPFGLFQKLEDFVYWAQRMSEILDGTTSDPGNQNLLNEAESVGFNFPIVSDTLPTVLNILKGETQALFTYKINLVKELANEYGIPVGTVLRDSNNNVIFSLTEDYFEFNFDIDNIYATIVERVREAAGDTIADGVEFMLDVLGNQSIEIEAAFRLQSSITVGLDTYFITNSNGSASLGDLADGFFIGAKEPLFLSGLDLKVKGTYPSAGFGLSDPRTWSVPDEPSDVTDPFEQAIEDGGSQLPTANDIVDGIKQAGEVTKESLDDAAQFVEDTAETLQEILEALLELGFNASFEFKVSGDASLALGNPDPTNDSNFDGEPGIDPVLRPTEIFSNDIGCLLEGSLSVNGSVGGSITLAGQEKSISPVDYVLVDYDSGSCKSNQTGSGTAEPGSKLDFAEERGGTLYVYGSADNDVVEIRSFEDSDDNIDQVHVFMNGARQVFDRDDIDQDRIIVDLRGETDPDDIVLNSIDKSKRSKPGGNDRLTITSSLDASFTVTANAGDGDDRLTARSGGDFFGGHVILLGGGGKDSLEGGGGVSIIGGEEGNDTLITGAGESVLHGGADNDTLIGLPDDLGIGTNTSRGALIGGEGNDYLGVGNVNRGNFTLIGGDVNDPDTADAGLNVLVGGYGNDHLIGGNAEFIDFFTYVGLIETGGGSTMLGGPGDDSFIGTPGRDRIIGGWLNSTISAGFDTIDAGGNDDTILAGNVAAGLTDSPYSNQGSSGAMDADGGDGNDFIVGGRGNDTISGGSGNDVIAGGLGHNTATGGSGNDFMISGIGVDNFSGGTNDDTFFVRAFLDPTATGTSSLDGNNGEDKFVFISTHASLPVVAKGNAGDDSFTLGNFTDTLADIQGEVTIEGGSHDTGDPVVLNDFGDLFGNNYRITNNRIERQGAAAINYTTVESIEVNTGTGEDVFDVVSTLGTTPLDINAGADADQFNIGTGNLDTIEGAVTIAAEGGAIDHAFLDDGGTELSVDYVVNPMSVTSFKSDRAPANEPERAFAGVLFDGDLESLRLDGTDVTNIFDVSPSEDTKFFIDGNEPNPREVCAVHGDFLKLNTDGTEGRDLTITGLGEGFWSFTSDHRNVQFESIERFNHVGIVAVGADAGAASTPIVRVFDAETLDFKFEFLAFDAAYQGGVQVAVGDVNEDGLPDVITAPGRLHTPEVRIFDGAPQAGLEGTLISGMTLAGDATYGHDFEWGVNVAVGDVTGDGCSDIVTAPGRYTSTIKVFENQVIQNGLVPFDEIRSFDAFPDHPLFIGGATVAVADFDGDRDGNDRGDIVVGAQSGSTSALPPQVRVFDVGEDRPDYSPIWTIFPADQSFEGGVTVSTGDVSGDGVPDIITGSGPGGFSQVTVYEGIGNPLSEAPGTVGANVLYDGAAFSDPSFTAPIRTHVIDYDNDDQLEVFVWQGPDGRNESLVKVFNLAGVVVDQFFSEVGTLHAEGGQGPGSTRTVTSAQLDSVAEEAIARWQEAGITRLETAFLRLVDFEIGDLPNGVLGTTQGLTITIDIDGAGYGWFVDSTLSADEEFAAQFSTYQAVATGGNAHGNMDLLTVVMHEIGHILGLPDVSDPVSDPTLMHEELAVSTRRFLERIDLQGLQILRNTELPFDVNDDLRVTLSDALLIISHMRNHGAGSVADLLQEQVATAFDMLDVNGDEIISLADALLVVGELRIQRRDQFFGAGEGDSAATDQAETAFLPIEVPASEEPVEGFLPPELFFANDNDSAEDNELNEQIHLPLDDDLLSLLAEQP